MLTIRVITPHQASTGTHPGEICSREPGSGPRCACQPATSLPRAKDVLSPWSWAWRSSACTVPKLVLL